MSHAENTINCESHIPSSLINGTTYIPSCSFRKENEINYDDEFLRLNIGDYFGIGNWIDH